MKSTSVAAAVALLSGAADAFWRMECHSPLGVARMDSIVDPGKASSHAHTLHGGGNMNLNANFEDLRSSNCTSCRVTQDTSAYWTPTLNFIHANGTAELVEQVGGMLAYYLLYGENITAFPAGFQMLAGDTFERNFSGVVPDPPKSNWGPADMTQHALGQKAIGMNCLNYKKQAEPSMYRHFLPTQDYMDANCVDGIRAELMFPSCWDGIHNDTANHKDHVAYPNLVNGGTCPKGFEKRLPSLFFETIWNTYAFKGMAGQFVFSNGDPTGYGYHGDFVMGWDPKFLQSAVNTCTNPSGEIEDCPLFDIISEQEAAKCTLEMPSVLEKDNCKNNPDGLCGNVQVQAGPGYAKGAPAGNTNSQTAKYTPPASTGKQTTTLPAIPTLSYKSATAAITDNSGGGVSLGKDGQVKSNAGEINTVATHAPSSPSSAPVVAAAAVSSAAPVASSVPEVSSATPVASSSAPVAAPPAPTPAPQSPQPSGKIMATSTYTSAGIVYEVAEDVVEVYVTVDVPAPQKQKRHAHHVHRHHHRDREHGLLGRR